MKQEDIARLIGVRKLLITQYSKLDGQSNPGTAVMLQRDVAALIESAVRNLDGVLSQYVEIKNKS